MSSFMPWIRYLWENSGGHLLNSMDYKRRQKLKDLYWRCQHKELEQLPRERHRKLSMSSTVMPIGFYSTSQRTKLLTLPAEVRFLIWEHVFGGHLIALYRDNRRLTHTLLNDKNSRIGAANIPVNIDSIHTELTLLARHPHNKAKKVTRVHKLRALAALQSCRSM